VELEPVVLERLELPDPQDQLVAQELEPLE
jgi:hypothetical protein